MVPNTADTERNKQAVRDFYEEVFHKHDLGAVDRFMHDDYIQHNADCPQGKAGFVWFFDVIFRAVPDFKYTLKRMIAEGDIVMAYSATTGTHTGGAWLGKEATGNGLSFDVVDIFRVQDGKIAEHWDVADTFSLFSQLGIAGRLLKEQAEGRTS